MFLTRISKQTGAAETRSITSEIADTTLMMSQGVPVSLPSMRMRTTFLDHAPEVLVSVLRALNYETAWLSHASLVQETSGSSRWSLEMSLDIGEEGDAILSSLVPDRSETPGREVKIREVVGGGEEEEL